MLSKVFPLLSIVVLLFVMGFFMLASLRFRRLHITGMVLNVVQLGTVAWGLTRLAT